MEVKVDLNEAAIVIPRLAPPKEMLSIGEENGKQKVRINSSSLSVIQECLRKSQYLLDEKWHSKNESPATIFGSAIHKALEIFYGGNIIDRKLPELETLELMSYGHSVEGEESDLILRAVRAFIVKADPLKALPETNKRSIQNGVWILWHYFKSFIDDPYIAYRDERGIFTEREFTFRLHEDSNLIIDYFGTIDLIVQHVDTGAIMICDHKTSSVVGNDFYNRLKPNHQYTGYLFGALEQFGIKTDQFFVNCLQVKAKPTTKRGTDPHFPRQVTNRDQDDFEEFKDAVVWAVTNYIDALAINTFPLGHVNACAMYGGCQFISVCSAPKSLRQNILNANFKRKTNEIK